MKYNELHRFLSEHGCEPTNQTMGGHPCWFSPKTQNVFKTGHHGKEEVSTGTRNGILREAGLLEEFRNRGKKGKGKKGKGKGL